MITNPALRLVKARRWQLIEPMPCKIMNEEFIVTAGFETDLATIPSLFWWILPPDGLYATAAIIHDWLYTYAFFDRKKCDHIFYEAMGQAGVPWCQKKLLFFGVRMFGGSRFGRL